MSTTLKETHTIKSFEPGIVGNDVKSHANDPAVLRQVEKAKQTLKRVGLPKQKLSSEK
jgi:hypothetical protein